MKNSSIEQLKINIITRYAIALSLIAILSTIAFYSLHLVLKDSDNTAFIVNISGKQRMLSQHIALDVHRVHQIQVEDESNSHHERSVKQTLERNTKEMLRANKMLSSGDLPGGVKVDLTWDIREMYFGEMDLAQRVRQYVTLAKEVVQAEEHLQSHRALLEIDLRSEALLVDLNKVVQQYQVEGEEKLEYMRFLETMIWVATLMALLLEVIFIFQPMVRRISKLSYREAQSLDQLQHQVEIRTLHLEQARQKLEELAFYDPLTGLRNRLTLETDIEHIISQHAVHDAPYAVLMIDIDWFKKVNDEYGHAIGDLVLVEIAKILKRAVRTEDKIYRAGGEEFVILLNRVTYDNSIMIAEKIRILVEAH